MFTPNLNRRSYLNSINKRLTLKSKPDSTTSRPAFPDDKLGLNDRKNKNKKTNRANSKIDTEFERINEGTLLRKVSKVQTRS